MAITVTHPFVSAISDDPAAVAAGQVVPSNWNATHSISGTLDVANGGTGVTTSTGTGSVVLSNSPTLVTPALGTPSSGVVTNLTGTASININGTVGATTPTTGAFTTINASSTSTLTGNVGIGNPPTNDALRVSGTASGSTFINGVLLDEMVGSGVTSAYRSVLSRPILENATFTLNNLYHFYANPQTKPAAATLSNQYGFHAESTLTDATVNYGFYGSIASGTGRWNVYAAGTAPNYFAGNVGIGQEPGSAPFRLGGIISTSGTTVNGATLSQRIASSQTGGYFGIYSATSTEAATFTASNFIHFMVDPAAKGAGSTITAQFGFYAQSSLNAGTNNYGFYSNIAAAGNRWNFYANGTAQNYFAGNTFIGATTGDQALNVNGAVRVANITTANQTSAGTMDFTGGNLRFLVWGSAGVQGTIQWWTAPGGSGATQRMTLTGSNNLGLATATFGTSATNTFSVANGTAPTTGVADTVQYYSSDLSAGNTIPSFYTEGTGIVGTGTPTANRTIAVRFNGTVYYLLASTIP